jgi:hypothetical protein
MGIDLSDIGGIVLREDFSKLKIRIINSDKFSYFLILVRKKLSNFTSLYNEVKLKRTDIITIDKYIFTEEEIKKLIIISRKEKIKSIK